MASVQVCLYSFCLFAASSIQRDVQLTLKSLSAIPVRLSVPDKHEGFP
jgi:hypothetical protein